MSTSTVQPVATRATPTPSAAHSFPGRILEHASRQPDAPAVVMGEEVLTFRELIELARRLMKPLEGEDRIAVLAHKTPRTIALVLGALLADRSVLVLAPNMPEERSTAVVYAAGIRVLVDPLSDDEVTMRPIRYGTESDESSSQAGPRLLLTTSGTTGVPKVVPLPLDAVDRFVSWAGSEFDLGSSSTVLNLAPLNFDLTLLEVWATLARGGCTVLVPPERAIRGAHVLDAIEQNSVELVQGVPTFYRLMLESATASGRRLSCVRTLILTGDRVAPTTVAQLRAMFPRARILNVYGMTETNDSFMHEASESDPVEDSLPIGSPLPGVEVRVLAEDGTTSEFGIGELLVHTPFQASRYLGPSGSAERFVRIGSSTAAGPEREEQVFIRTGDLIERREGQPARLLGRRDRRVKIRGLAVDLSEVERMLETHPSVLMAAAVAEADPLAGHRLAVVVQCTYPGELDLLDLRSFARMRLAGGSSPSEFHVLDFALPLTITGKIDRPRALAMARGDLERH